ncbi:ABC transporter substrate-binding protein [Helicobacter muridarum]|nr:ABC transporter substrate-binding protein [Helicobacter muridarum]STQ85640.1 iron(III) ABC transporter periplasmic iron-binding protein [Helicobacter muridarum]
MLKTQMWRFYFVLFTMLYLSVLGQSKNTMIVLDPASIEILYMIGAEDEILAIPDMKTIEPKEKTKKLQKVGTFTNPSIEKILSLKPKIVILTSYSIGLKDQLERQKIKTMQLPVNSLKDIQNNIITLGDITNKQENAKKLLDDFNDKLVQIKAMPVNKRAVFIYSATPLMVFGANTLPSDVLDAIGVDNIAKDIVGQRPILSPEFLLKENPEVILYGLRITDKNELINANPAFKHLNAVKNDNVYFLELHSLLRGSPNIINEILRIKKDIFGQKTP